MSARDVSWYSIYGVLITARHIHTYSWRIRGVYNVHSYSLLSLQCDALRCK